MTVRYVNWAAADDTGDGLSYANAKKTLNGVEDTPVASGDIIYVRAGTYRELLTCDVSGASAITYIGDVTGEHTDGVGGVVRVTGSDNDTTAARASCITATSKNYRTFRGFTFDTCSGNIVIDTTGDNWTIEDCVFTGSDSAGDYGIYVNNVTPENITVQRCIFTNGSGVQFYHTASAAASSCVVQNCLFLGEYTGVYCWNIDSVVIKNCTFYACTFYAIRSNGLTAATSITVNNSLFYRNAKAMNANAAGEIVSNYNSRFNNDAADTNVSAGAQDNTYPAMPLTPLLLDGLKFPWRFGELAPWSQVKRIGGTGESADDLYGIARPATSAKKSWGAFQYTGAVRETTTVHDTSAASLKLPDAGEQFLMRVPVTAVSTTFSLYCYREADYAGTNPQMILRQPGQSDTTVTDTGDASNWNQLTSTITPAASPPYVDIFVKSSNTATATNFDTFFDTVAVS